MDNLYGENTPLEWYYFGLKHKSDNIIKFMTHWFAFNWLYDEMSGRTERDRIIKFCEEKMNILAKYDAFSDEAISVFLEYPVKSEKHHMYKYANERFNAVKNKSISALFETMYMVRCNLFHGSKSMRNSRDVKLVESSAVILEGYLNVYLKYLYGKKFEDFDK